MKKRKKQVKNEKKILKITGIILGVVILVLLFDYLRINIAYLIIKDKYDESFRIPGNTGKYMPQGMAYNEDYNVVLQTSYNKDGEPSKLFVIDYKTNKIKKELLLKDKNNNYDNRHVGGVATSGDRVWITSDYIVTEYSLAEILNTSDNYIKSIDTNKLPIRGDFCYADDSNLWIGDFCLRPFYPVPDNNPLLMAFDSENIDYKQPILVISLPKMVQGMTITKDNEFVFTRSFTNLIQSELVTYRNVLNDKPDTYKLNNNDIPYYHFTKKDLIGKEKLPPMAEGLFTKNNYLYITFENSSDNYFYAYPKLYNTIKKKY